MDEELRGQKNKVDFRNPNLYFPHYYRVEWGNIKFPAKLEDLNKIEELNPNIAINLLLAPADKNDEVIKTKSRGKREANHQKLLNDHDHDENKFKPVSNITTLRTSKYNNRENVINLLMIYKVSI